MPFNESSGFSIGEYTVPYWLGGAPFNTPNVKMPSAQITERRVELPLACLFLKIHGVKDTIELGGVTPYYLKSTHEVIDIQDPHSRCLSKDIRHIETFKGKNVLTVSTLEHVRTIAQSLTVVEKIRDESKHYLITFPLGSDIPFDEGIYKMEIDNKLLLFRTNIDNDWAEAPFELTYDYGKPYKYANAICVLSDQPVEALCRSVASVT